jgi:hypothetical protein
MKAASAGAAAVGAAVMGGTTARADAKATKLWTLEGELKVHPKYLYRYYLVLGDMQQCGLFGADHGRESDQLARLELPHRVRVRGVLGAQHHAGGTKDNPSPFPETWFVYMDVHEVEALGKVAERRPAPEPK